MKEEFLDPECNLNLTTGFSIKLGNGQKWQLLAGERLRPWLTKLATIMGLKPFISNGYQKLIFVQRRKDMHGERDIIPHVDADTWARFPWYGWKALDLKLLQIWSNDHVSDKICEIDYEESDYMLRIFSMRISLYPIYQKAQETGGLLLHAAVIEHCGKGLLLAGSPEAGKSTCCSRLSPPWHVLSDDETLVLRHNNSKYIAHPFPTWNNFLKRHSLHGFSVERYVPLSTIFFLERAQSDEVFPIGEGHAAIMIYESSMQKCLLVP